MKKKKDPLVHFPFYVNQYLGILQKYSYEEQGAFLQVLSGYVSADGDIPQDDRKYRFFLAFSEGEKKALDFVYDEAVLLAREIIATQKNIRKTRRENGKKGGRPKNRKDNRKETKRLTNTETETETELDIETETKTETLEKEKKHPKKEAYSEEFEKAWVAYSRKGSKKYAFTEWKKLDKDEKERAMANIVAYENSLSDLRYKKDFERYLKSGKFEQDFSAPMKKINDEDRW